MRFIVREEGQDRIVELAGPAVSVGRAPHCDLVIKEPRASREHIRVLDQKGGLRVEDLRSRNGTLLNGKPLQESELKAGDCLQIGQTRVWLDFVPTQDLMPAAAAGAEGSAKPDGGMPESGQRWSLKAMAGGGGERLAIHGQHFTVGRARSNDLVLDDPRVSGQHARIEVLAAGLIVRDLGSTNGTRVNGEKVKDCEVGHGDVLAFDKHSYQVVEAGKPEAGPSACQGVPAPSAAPAPPADPLAEDSEAADPEAAPDAPDILYDTTSIELAAQAAESRSRAFLVAFSAMLLVALVLGARLVLNMAGSRGADPRQASNEVEDWSFEDGRWELVPGAALDADRARGGNRSLRLTPGASRSGEVWAWSPGTWTVRPGQAWTIRASIRASANSIGLIAIRWESEAGKGYSRLDLTPAQGEGDWNLLRAVLEAPSGADRARIACVALGSAGSVWFDRLECLEGGELPPDRRLDADAFSARVGRRGAVWIAGAQGTLLDRLVPGLVEGARPVVLKVERVLRDESGGWRYEGSMFDASSGRWSGYSQTLAVRPDGLRLEWNKGADGELALDCFPSASRLPASRAFGPDGRPVEAARLAAGAEVSEVLLEGRESRMVLRLEPSARWSRDSATGSVRIAFPGPRGSLGISDRSERERAWAQAVLGDGVRAEARGEWTAARGRYEAVAAKADHVPDLAADARVRLGRMENRGKELLAELNAMKADLEACPLASIRAAFERRLRAARGLDAAAGWAESLDALAAGIRSREAGPGEAGWLEAELAQAREQIAQGRHASARAAIEDLLLRAGREGVGAEVERQAARQEAERLLDQLPPPAEVFGKE